MYSLFLRLGSYYTQSQGRPWKPLQVISDYQGGAEGLEPELLDGRLDDQLGDGGACGELGHHQRLNKSTIRTIIK